MFQIRVERTIKKDIDTVFDALTDHGAYDQFPGVDRSVLQEPGSLEKNGQGALRIIGAGPLELYERITEFKRPVRMHYHIEQSRPFKVDHQRGEITLEKVGQQTRVVWISTGHVQVPLLGHLLDKVAQRQFTKAFASLLKAIDQR